MLYANNTEKLLGLQGVCIKNIETKERVCRIYLEMERKPHECPCCHRVSNNVHDYRQQKIKDIPAFGNTIYLILRKRRYSCPHCQKRFAEKTPFLPKYRRMTNRLAAYVIDKLRSECSFTSVARDVNLSVSTIIRIFDLVGYPTKYSLPEAIAIDEFKGNTGHEKYQCILTDPENKVVLDILPKRYDSYLSEYFFRFPREERKKVKFFVSDMWKPYAEACSVWFSSATYIVDKYHWVRQAIWAFEAVRKEAQKILQKDYRRYLKRSRKLLIKRFNKLSDEQKQQVNVLLYASPTLSSAHFLKEQFLAILDAEDAEAAAKSMAKWIMSAHSSGISQFSKCALTMQNWAKGILNSFSHPLTNGFTEGCNNKIKVLKRNAYGYRNFKRFRNRILHMFSHQRFRLNAEKAAS